MYTETDESPFFHITHDDQICFFRGEKEQKLYSRKDRNSPAKSRRLFTHQVTSLGPDDRMPVPPSGSHGTQSSDAEPGGFHVLRGASGTGPGGAALGRRGGCQNQPSETLGPEDGGSPATHDDGTSSERILA